MIIKVVYFDEGSATDFIYISEGGKPEEQSEKIITKSRDLALRAEGKAEAKFKLLSFLSASAGAEASAEFSREGNTLLRKAISNTILTDYLSIINALDDDEKFIEIFDDCLLYPYPESFAYYKMLTPYMIMTEGKIDVGSDIKVNVALMDAALESGRGYYELIAEKEKTKYVLRLNIQAFRNNYSISDLVKMNLQYHAIRVGSIPESSLTMQSEFSKMQKNITGFDLTGHSKDDKELMVYDVILAGVKND